MKKYLYLYFFKTKIIINIKKLFLKLFKIIKFVLRIILSYIFNFINNNRAYIIILFFNYNLTIFKKEN